MNSINNKNSIDSKNWKSRSIQFINYLWKNWNTTNMVRRLNHDESRYTKYEQRIRCSPVNLLQNIFFCLLNALGWWSFTVITTVPTAIANHFVNGTDNLRCLLTHCFGQQTTYENEIFIIFVLQKWSISILFSFGP